MVGQLFPQGGHGGVSGGEGGRPRGHLAGAVVHGGGSGGSGCPTVSGGSVGGSLGHDQSGAESRAVGLGCGESGPNGVALLGAGGGRLGVGVGEWWCWRRVGGGVVTRDGVSHVRGADSRLAKGPAGDETGQGG